MNSSRVESPAPDSMAVRIIAREQETVGLGEQSDEDRGKRFNHTVLSKRLDLGGENLAFECAVSALEAHLSPRRLTSAAVASTIAAASCSAISSPRRATAASARGQASI